MRVCVCVCVPVRGFFLFAHFVSIPFAIVSISFWQCSPEREWVIDWGFVGKSWRTKKTKIKSVYTMWSERMRIAAAYTYKLNGPIHTFIHFISIYIFYIYRQIMFFGCRLIIKGTGFISLSKYTSSWFTMPRIHFIQTNCLYRLHYEKSHE